MDRVPAEIVKLSQPTPPGGLTYLDAWVSSVKDACHVCSEAIARLAQNEDNGIQTPKWLTEQYTGTSLAVCETERDPAVGASWR